MTCIPTFPTAFHRLTVFQVCTRTDSFASGVIQVRECTCETDPARPVIIIRGAYLSMMAYRLLRWSLPVLPHEVREKCRVRASGEVGLPIKNDGSKNCTNRVNREENESHLRILLKLYIIKMSVGKMVEIALTISCNA